MKKTYIRWILAIIITLGAAVYQRLTGPTYPLRGSITLADQQIKYKLTRSHGGEGNQPVQINLSDSTYIVYLLYKRYKTADDWTKSPMKLKDGQIFGELPHQPPAGKLEYYILLEKDNTKYSLPAERTVVTRFKGAVPAWVLLPHVLFMFIAMLISNMSALEAIVKGERILLYTIITSVCLFLGGMILGPIVQNFAFGDYWTGIPFGYDLTDNKTLLAMIGWLIAMVQVSRKKGTSNPWWVVGAAILLLLVYSIPHSTLGSELDYEKMEIIQGD